MKKFFAAAMAAVLALGLNVGAFAATTGNATYDITKISGAPIDEDGKVLAIGDSIAPNQKIYFLIPENAAKQLTNTKNFRLSTRKSKNGKLVKSVKLVEKKLSNSATPYYLPVDAATPIDTTNPAKHGKQLANARNTYLEIQLNDTTSTDEVKVELTATFSAKKTSKAAFAYAPSADAPGTLTNYFFGTHTAAANDVEINTGDKLELKVGIYIANKNEKGDATVTVGAKGVIVKPDANSDNEVIFEGDDTMATLTFRANNNPDKFYAKLSTKWTSTLLNKFKNTDAVIRNFSAATIDATSRATLALNNPFDEDVNPKKVSIYTANSKGKLKDVTRQFTYNEDDDTFETKTRTLGTYIISNVKVSTK